MTIHTKPSMNYKDHTTWAYLRVSTWAQDILKDRQQITEYAKTHNLSDPVFFEDHESGAIDWKKRKISEIVEQATKGDVILVTEISRLARSLGSVIDIIRICTDKGVHILTVKENIRVDGTLGGKYMGQLFALMAEVERDLLIARTADARATRAAENVKNKLPTGCGKSKLDKYKDDIIARIVKGDSKKDIAADCKSSVNNLNTYLNKRNYNILIQDKIRQKMGSLKD